jgi:hypothetical protein
MKYLKLYEEQSTDEEDIETLRNIIKNVKSYDIMGTIEYDIISLRGYNITRLLNNGLIQIATTMGIKRYYITKPARELAKLTPIEIATNKYNL